MKRVMMLVLAGVMSLGLGACGNNNPPSPTKDITVEQGNDVEGKVQESLPGGEAPPIGEVPAGGETSPGGESVTPPAESPVAQ